MPGVRAATHVPESVPHAQSANQSRIEQDFLHFFFFLIFGLFKIGVNVCRLWPVSEALGQRLCCEILKQFLGTGIIQRFLVRLLPTADK